MLNKNQPNKNKINLLNKWIIIIRANFLLATFIPLLFAITWSLQYIKITDLNISLLLATIIGIISCHIAANTFNDYFDWQSGADQANFDYIPTLSGGSRAIENGFITERNLFILASINLLIAACCAVYITCIRGPYILILSAIGAFSSYFYTSPPIRLAARYGLGELFVFLSFGPILIAGIIYVLTNQINLTTFLVGVPIGFLITSCLLMNEYPDQKADLLAKKFNFAVILGKKIFIIASYNFNYPCLYNYFRRHSEQCFF